MRAVKVKQSKNFGTNIKNIKGAAVVLQHP